MNTAEKQFYGAVQAALGFDFAQVDAVIRSARGILTSESIKPLVVQRRHALTLFVRGFHDDAMQEARVAIASANGMHNAVMRAPAVITGNKVRDGGARGAAKTNSTRSVDAIRPAIIKAIKAYKGNERSMASNIANKFKVSPRYVRKIKAELALS